MFSAQNLLPLLFDFFGLVTLFHGQSSVELSRNLCMCQLIQHAVDKRTRIAAAKPFADLDSFIETDIAVGISGQKINSYAAMRRISRSTLAKRTSFQFSVHCSINAVDIGTLADDSGN